MIESLEGFQERSVMELQGEKGKVNWGEGKTKYRQRKEKGEKKERGARASGVRRLVLLGF